MKNRRKLKRNKNIYREFPPNVMDLGGYISPYEEIGLNTDNAAKPKNTYMTAGQEVGWAALDILASPVGISGKPLSGYLTNKRSSVTGSKGSTFGTIESQYMHPVAQEVMKAFPVTKPFAEAGQAIGDMVSPMVNADDPNAVANRQMMKGIGGAVSQAGQSINNSAQNWGAGKKSFNLGGQLPMNMNLNELNGPSHEEGGMSISPQVEVEGNETIFEPESYVFSDSLTVPGKKKTFAQESKSIKRKYDLRPEDKLSQNAMNRELEELMYLQESLKQEAIMNDINAFQNQMEMKYGGKIRFNNGGGLLVEDPLVEDPSRGTFPEITMLPNNQINPLGTNVFKNGEFVGIPAKASIDPIGIQSLPESNFTTDLRNSSLEDPIITPETAPIIDGVSGVLGVKLDSTPTKSSTQKEYKQDPDKYNNLANNIAMAAAGAKGLNKQKLLLTPRLKMNYLNSRPAEILAENQASQSMAAGLDALRSSGASAAQVLGGAAQLVNNINRTAAGTVADLRLKRDMQNTEIANQLAANNQGIARENNALTTQYDAAQMLRRDKILDDFSRIGQSRIIDDKQRDRELNILESLGKENYMYDKNGRAMVKLDGKNWVYLSDALKKLNN